MFSYNIKKIFLTKHPYFIYHQNLCKNLTKKKVTFISEVGKRGKPKKP